jgi:hypothetical protein
MREFGEGPWKDRFRIIFMETFGADFKTRRNAALVVLKPILIRDLVILQVPPYYSLHSWLGSTARFGGLGCGEVLSVF